MAARDREGYDDAVADLETVGVCADVDDFAHELVAKDVAAAFTSQIEVGVVGEVDNRIFVRRRRIFDAQFVVAAERVGDVHFQIAGIAFFPIFTQIAESHGRAAW